MSKSVFIIPQAGLCNRMRVINGGIDLAHKLNATPILIWCNDKNLNSSFSNLFQNLDIMTYETEINSILFKFLLFYAKRIKNSIEFDDDYIVKHFRGNNTHSFEEFKGKNIIINSCQSVTLSEDFGMFKISNEIAQNILNFGKDTIGIHIRRTDNKKSVLFSPTELFVERIDQEITENKNVKFYLATDDLNEERFMKQRYGDRIICYPKTSLDRNNPQAIKEALIDLYHLSKCSKIFASYYSSFSDVAAMWGNIHKEVIKKESI